MEKYNKKIVNAWCMYDWANSVYNLVITSTMFPAYYEEITKGENGKGIVHFLGHDYVNTALYNYALGVAFLIVAFMSPILSSIVDGKPEISFISKEEAAKIFVGETKENFSTLLNDNPLHDAFLCKIKEEYFNESSLSKLKKEIEKFKGVSEVTYVENLADDINKNISKIYLIMSSFVILLLLTIIALVNNTIKLAVFSQRFLIRSMQLVGATNYFIQKPFVIRGAVQGAISALIALVILVLVQQGAISQVPELLKLSTVLEFVWLALFLIVQDLLSKVLEALAKY